MNGLAEQLELGLQDRPLWVTTELLHRLRRLDAMYDAMNALMNRALLGRDTFARGAPEGLVVDRSRRWTCSWYDFCAAQARVAARQPDLSELEWPGERTCW